MGDINDALVLQLENVRLQRRVTALVAIKGMLQIKIQKLQGELDVANRKRGESAIPQHQERRKD